MPLIETEASAAIGALHQGSHKVNSNHREVRVSFRNHDGTIGRRDVATHWIHWYPAKMFRLIPSVILESIPLPSGATILDPFCGSGTVPLEATIRGFSAIGIDINPLAQLITKAKVTPLDPMCLNALVEPLIERAKASTANPSPETVLDSWLRKPARVALHRLAIAVFEIEDVDIRSYFMVTLTSIVRRVSVADPAVPPLVRLNPNRAEAAGARYSAALKKSISVTMSSVFAAFREAARANIKRMAEFFPLSPCLGAVQVPIGLQAADTGLSAGSVNAIITSPPYCGAQKYVRSLKLEMSLIGYSQNELRSFDQMTLGSEALTSVPNRLEDLFSGDELTDQTLINIHKANPVRARMAGQYAKYLQSFARECQRVLGPDGHLFVTLGRSLLAGIPFNADQVFLRAASNQGLIHQATLVDRIPSRGLFTKRHPTAGRMDHEFTVWMKSPATLGKS